MKEVWINHKLVDFVNAIRRHKISPGCSLYGEEEHEHGAEAQVQAEAETGLSNDEDGEADGYVKEHIIEDTEEEGAVASAAVENLNPCQGNKCKHGSQCIPQTPSDYTCKCPPMWAGKFCDQGTNSFFSETTFKSAEAVSVRDHCSLIIISFVSYYMQKRIRQRVLLGEGLSIKEAD